MFHNKTETKKGTAGKSEADVIDFMYWQVDNP